MSRRKRGIKVSEARPQWHLGGVPNRAETVTTLLLVVVAAAALCLEPGFNRPLRHLPVALGAVCGGYASWHLLRTHLPYRGALTCVALAAWWLLSVFSWGSSVDGFRSYQAMCSWSAAMGVFLLAALGFTSGRSWRACVIALTLCAGVASVGAVLMRAPGQAMMGYFTNRDTFSVIPMVGVFLSLSLAKSPGGFRVLALGGTMAFALITLLTSSRAGTVGICLGLLAWLGALALNQTVSDFKRAARLAGGGFAILLVLGTVTGIIQPLLSRFNEATDGKDIQGVTMRMDVVTYGLKASRLHPLLGSGPGTFALAYQQFRPAGVLPDYITVNYAHDDYMELLVETGYPAFFCWLLFGCLVILRGIRLIRFSMATWESSCFVGAIIALGTFSIFNFIFPVPAVLIWQMLILGLLQGLPAAQPPTAPSSAGQKLAAFLLSLVSLASLWGSVSNLRTGLLVRKAEKLAEALRYEEAVSMLDQALKIQPGHGAARLARGKMLTTVGAFRDKGDLSKKGQADLDLAHRISPKDQELARIRLAYYSAAKNYAKAEEVLSEANSNAPYFEWHLTTLARLQLLQGKLESAARTLQADSVQNPGARALLPKFLLQLESHRSGAGVSLLGEWAGREGDAGTTLTQARDTARLALDEHLLAVANRLLSFVLSKDPKDTESLYLQSRVYEQQGDRRKQRETLVQLSHLATDSPSPDPNVDSALVDLAKMSHVTLASPEFHSLEARLKKFPASVPLRLLISQVYMDNGKIDDASDVLAAGLDSAPENADLLARMGTCLKRQNLNELAQKYYEQALKASPRQREARDGMRKLRHP